MANQLQVVLLLKPRTQNDIVIVKNFYILLFLFTLTVQLRFLNFQSLIKRKWNIRYMYHHIDLCMKRETKVSQEYLLVKSSENDFIFLPAYYLII